ncbi:hypothetical protein ASE73_14935 [Sphingomonas sp. Leaf24]|uniref:hypothetical protein n=1 Tax=unclassified Sphingomonas TaxID=196159 RepID=UPI0006F5C4C7|nr:MULTISPECIES: hypothetical protein [unclassified Sphingomonas]KQM21676.1 hypothetical protein ASE50_13155 [Sphingomonas sp. Leaf5]KQM93779.1 hypothetical protein ASE73_14935 [Sphingomonas sp. Leaf24]
MFRQKTTFVIGAGASCELGLPSGETLKLQILDLLQPTDDNVYGFVDKTMIEIMRLRVGPDVWEAQAKLAPMQQAAERIRRGLPLAMSIDNFLHSHYGDGDVEYLGKLAIAICILRAEGSSHLFLQPDPLASYRYEKTEKRL